MSHRWTEDDLTDWFPHYKKPKRVGTYEVRSVVGWGYAWWDGKLWGWTAASIGNMQQFGDERAAQSKSWRGLREGALIARSEGLT